MRFWIKPTAACALVVLAATSAPAQRTLYNGIVLPSEWPPRRTPTQRYLVPSYLTNPPAVIPIDLGRQLFVDDFLIQQTDLVRTAHRPRLFNGNPILEPGAWPDSGPYAMPFSDGVWFDPFRRLYRMWYYGGFGGANGLSRHVSYAVSANGKSWTKPVLPAAAVPNTNIVIDPGGRDSSTVWLDLEDSDPSRRYKAFIFSDARLLVYFSADGISWVKQPFTIPAVGDRTTLFWNAFRKVWVHSARGLASLPAVPGRGSYFSRIRYYSESPDLLEWKPGDPTQSYWTGPDVNDPKYSPRDRHSQLYNLDAVSYESVLVGLFSWLHPDSDLVELGVGFSRDGFSWVRPTRGFGADAFIRATNRPGSWNGYNTQSAGGGFLVVGDELWFYFTGRDTPHSTPVAEMGHSFSTGLAMLRRDGFYSMDAGASEGRLTTRPVRFSGDRLFVNVDCPAGALRVEVLDQAGNPIAPFTKQNSNVIRVNKTLQQVTWSGASNLSAVAGRPVRLRFSLTNGSLYSFWVTPNPNGASFGYVAAGGPAYPGPVDVIGNPALHTDNAPPQIAVTTPAGGATVFGRTLFRATASDNFAVQQVQFHVDGADLGAPDLVAPYALTLNTNDFVDGSHVVTATATDTSGRTRTSAPVSFRVSNAAHDSSAPDVAVTFPPRNTEVSGTVSFQATATDNVGVASVQFLVDGAPYGPNIPRRPFSLSVNTTTLAEGPHTLAARARDARGNQATSPVIPFVVHNGAAGAPLEALHVQATEIRATSAVIVWLTNKPATSSVEYGPGRPFDSETSTNTQLRRAHRVTLAGLTPGTEYSYRPRSEDAEGGRHNPCCFSFRTLRASGVSDPQPPAVTVTAPASDAKIAGTVTLRAQASDNRGVAGVQFQIGGLDVGSEDATAPYTASLDTTLLPEGVQVVWARARDAAGNTAVSPAVAVEVDNARSPDSEPPTVTVTAPTPNQEISGVFALRARARDNFGILDVRFLVDGAEVGSATRGPVYSINLDTDVLTPGPHRLTAIARDAAGNRATAGPINFIVEGDTVKPTVSIVSPAGGSTVEGPITIRANASDNRAIASVQLRLNGANFGAPLTSPPYSRNLDTRTLKNGAHTVGAIARDTAGNQTGTGPVSFTIRNDKTAPTVSIVSPTAGETVRGSITVRANASDNRAVARVQLRVNGANFGPPLTRAPYLRTLHTATLANGSHTIGAVAADEAGNTATAAPVSIRVGNVVTDGTPPARSNGAPRGRLAAGQRSARLSLTTNEAAVCRYSLTPGTSWGAMRQTFATTGGVAHQTSVAGLTLNRQHRYYVRCRDSAGNANGGDFLIQFETVSSASAPVRRYLEGEGGLRRDIRVGHDGNASGGMYAIGQRIGGTIEFAVNVPSAGNYTLWARGRAPSPADGTWAVFVDGAPKSMVRTGAVDWVWRRLGGARPTNFQLSAGRHSIVLRADGTKGHIDVVLLTNELSFVPSGAQAPPADRQAVQ